MSRWLRAHWPGIALGLVLAVILLYPGLVPGNLLGSPSLDNWSHAWGMHWWVDSWTHGRVPWTVTGAAFPELREHWYVDPIGATLTAPLQLISPGAAYNGLQLLQVALAGLCGWGFGRALGGRGWVAGTATALMPILQTEVHNGVVEAMWVAPVALSGWLAARRSRWTGVAVGLSVVCTPYHGVGSGLLAVTLLLAGGTEVGRRDAGKPVPSWGGRLADVALCVGVAGLVGLPHYRMLSSSFTTIHPFVNHPLQSNFDSPGMAINATDPRAFWMPGDWWSMPPSDGVLDAPWKHTPYLGWVLSAAALWGLRVRERVLWIPAAALLIATLGFFVWWDQAWLTTPAGGRYSLPLYWLNQVTDVALMHHMRFVAAGVVILAALADRAVARWGPAIAPLVGVEYLLVAPGAWPVPVSPARLPAVHAALPDDGLAVIDLPADSGNANRTNRYLYWQAVHDRPVPWVNKVGTMGTASMNDSLRKMVLVSKAGPAPLGGIGVPAADADFEAATAELRDVGFGYVILHPELCAQPKDVAAHERVLTELLGPPTVVGGQSVWSFSAPR